MTLRKIIHLDMDAFFASVEQRDDPSLRGRPVVVGGSPDGRGVVAAASYEVRRYGVRSAMPCREAFRRCPEAIFVRPDMARYREVSQQMRAILDRYTDLVEPLSIDEAFLDVTVNKVGLVHATEVARDIRRVIREELQLTASAGVAPVKFVAKIASDMRKPDGLTVVQPHQILGFLHPLPVEKLWGVGPATASRMHDLGIRRIGDLAQLPESALVERFGKHGAFLWGLAHGRDPRLVSPDRERKSRGSERTFEEDVRDLAQLRASLASQAERVCAGAKRAGERAATITLKLRYDDFSTITRSSSLDSPTHEPAEVMAVVDMLLDRTDAGTRPVRLIGVSLSNLTAGEGAQLDLPYDGTDDG